ncbi:MAG: hypothetical protein AAF573_03325 [Bacteroidota bacterium]
MKIVTLFMLLMLCSFSAFAQTASVGAAPSSENLSIVNLDDAADWSFYADEDNHTFYVDFEKINVNLSDVVIKDAEGMIVFKEDVLDLPVNAIYELDFAPFGAGDYVVELRSYTQVIKKEIAIK